MSSSTNSFNRACVSLDEAMNHTKDMKLAPSDRARIVSALIMATTQDQSMTRLVDHILEN